LGTPLGSRNAYFMEGGRRVYVDISLDEEEPSL
jgi:hypothetical protein